MREPKDWYLAVDLESFRSLSSENKAQYITLLKNHISDFVALGPTEADFSNFNLQYVTSPELVEALMEVTIAEANEPKLLISAFKADIDSIDEKKTRALLKKAAARFEELHPSVEQREEFLTLIPTVPKRIRKCQNVAELHLQKAGFRCLTTKGVAFERVEKPGFGEAWKDLSNGTIWSDLLASNASFDRALEICSGAFPSVYDFLEAEKHGFREVLPNMKGHKFWTTTSDNTHQQIFYGDDASAPLEGVTHGSSATSFDVRCIGN
jgi:hypothetical protein